MEDDLKPTTTVIGLGNPILSDDGVGPRVARELQALVTRPDVTVVEASIAGLDFLDLLAGYQKAIIIDAVQTGKGEVGEIYRLEPEAFRLARQAVTPHDVDLVTVLELGRMLKLPLPEQVVIFAIEVKDTETLGEDCTPEVACAIPRCLAAVNEELNGSPER